MNTLRGVSILVFTFVASFIFLLIYSVVRMPSIFYPIARWWGRCVCAIGGVKINIANRSENNHHRNTPVIYISNHRSLFDIPALLASVKDDIRIMYKAELNSIPVFGWLLHLSPYIAINRSDSRDALASIRTTAEEIRSGTSVLIFPEGTWSTTEEVLPFKRGTVVLSATASIPLVPLAMKGTEQIVPADTYTFSPGVVQIAFGNLIQPTTLSTREGEKEFAKSLHSTVVELLATL
jgi:1-acyl-sn-glycerol-3-phosphate acyltransferase